MCIDRNEKKNQKKTGDKRNLKRIVFCSITTTTRTETRTITSAGAGGTDELRESMQKIMDTFMTEEKKDH